MESGYSFQFSNRRIKPFTKFLVLAVCSIALMFVDGRFALIRDARSVITTILYPLQSIANTPLVWYNKASLYLTNQNTLHEENQKLKLENARLYAQIYGQKTVTKTLAELESLEQVKKSGVTVITTAEIIITNQNPFSNKLHISKGSNDGVMLGQAVVDSKGLLGQVSSVSSFISEVTLLISNKQITPVMIERTGDRALLYGSGNGIELRYLSSDVDLKENDRLVTSGSDGVYLSGIPVAQITKAEKNVASPFYRTKIIPLAGVRQSRFIFVLEKDALPPQVANALKEEINSMDTPLETSSPQLQGKP